MAFTVTAAQQVAGGHTQARTSRAAPIGAPYRRGFSGILKDCRSPGATETDSRGRRYLVMCRPISPHHRDCRRSSSLMTMRKWPVSSHAWRNEAASTFLLPCREIQHSQSRRPTRSTSSSATYRCRSFGAPNSSHASTPWASRVPSCSSRATRRSPRSRTRCACRARSSCRNHSLNASYRKPSGQP